MEKYLRIKINKGLLLLTEQELLENLPVSLIEKALNGGKWEKRREAINKRSEKEVEYNGINQATRIW